jgi:hypothetical protein
VFEHVAGLVVRCTDEEHVRIQHVADDGAEGNEFGVIAEAEVRPERTPGVLFERFP